MTVLRTGAEVPDGITRAVLLSLKRLMTKNPVALFELAELARDPSHRLAGGAGTVLRDLSLADEGGNLHDSVRAVVLAAVDGEGTGMYLRSPYAEGAGR
jgi:hypothetical protein